MLAENLDLLLIIAGIALMVSSYQYQGRKG
jgi:hypothetical protein